MNQPVYIDRPPRVQPELPGGERELPKPPQMPDLGPARLIQVGLPLITIIGYVLVAVVSGGNSLGLLIPMALSVVAAIGFSIYSFRKEQQRRVEIERAYANRLVELNKEMHTAHDLQRRFHRYNYPDQSATLQIAMQARAEAERTERTLRSEARLWERRTDDADFGALRLGIGTLPSTVIYRLSEIEDYTSPQARAARKIDSDSRFVDDIPVIISLRQPPKREAGEDQPPEDEVEIAMPVVHALGVAGERHAVYAFAQALLAHYTVFHAPADARLYVLASERRAWAWAEQVPHASGDDQNRFCCFTSEIAAQPAERAFGDEESGELEQFLEGIRRTLAQRKIRLQEREEHDTGGDPRLPFLLVVVDLLDATNDPHALLQGVETDAALAILLEEGHLLGAAVIFLVPERSKVPGSCRAVIEVERTTPATNSPMEQYQKLHFRYTEIGVNRPRYVGEADVIAAPAVIAQLASDLATVAVRQGSGANLAGAVPFMDLMGYTSLPDLSAKALASWDSSAQARHANWLRVRLGRMAGNKPRTLVFSAKRDGVHGMVAGSTGSGKSELLISLIAGMAVTYDPSVLNFVLVDYKGGGAFKEFAALPHCVDIITNLAADGVTRMFTAISAEMRRRQALNAATGTKNIVEYRQKGLHLSHAPYAFLFIIIDEFAEMIADRAEYKTELESITRVGRAQGVSLILAAQRPSGVTDQMRSNIKFRICLRVETPGESREMLRRPDATYLPPGVPGRGYLQVGNEEIELMQVAYSGDLYTDPQRAAIAPVIWPDRNATAIAQDQTAPELYKAIIEKLALLALDSGRPQQHAPWPGFLPPQLALAETLISDDDRAEAVTSAKYLVDTARITLGGAAEAPLTLNPAINRWLDGGDGWVAPLDWAQHALRPVIGLVDNPYAAQQLPLVVDLPRGHAVVFGASGSGKTTFIRTLITSLAATHAPDQLHAYLLDLGGRNLQPLAKLPHVGAVVTPDEEGYEERVAQILREVSEIVERRKLTLADAAATDVYQYNQQHPNAPLPAIVVGIDNFTAFIETFGGGAGDAETVLERFVALARQSKPYGVHFIITLTQLGSLSNQIYNLFSERFTLRLVDTSEYRAIVGGSVAEIGDVPGRGYTRIGRQPLAFQVAQPFDLRRVGLEANEVREIEQLARAMGAYMQASGRVYNLPIRVDALPTAVLLKKLIADQHQLALDTTFLPRLQEVTRTQWAKSTHSAHADWLKVLIGVASGNRARTLHLEAKKDGVHGMIAGGTGAGKSELLMTLIVSLALNYSPDILNFVLVDYKGGGAFAPFAALPHCVDTITNLNKAAVKRMFTAINAEMRRRQALNAETGTKDIIEYREKGLHLSREPYPHLFIIIDEYAEMISSSPEFGAELDSITRVGRAQGVNLLLASQRPTGVSDQMRANIKLRICLRVEGVDTSRELLRRPDAAYLPNGMPGRGYLQVGNEQIELVQMAYTGETYEHALADEGGEKPRFYDVAVKLANELLDKSERPRTPWPPFLPAAHTFDTPLLPRYLDREAQPLVTLGRSERLAINPFVQDWLAGRGAWHGVDWDRTAMRAVVGLIDDPHNARQLPLTLDFSKGHAVIFGASGWGKTTMLRSLIVSLAATHAPDEFQAHILDLGGRNLEVLEALPHVGTVIMPDERGYEERVQQLWRELNELIDARKRLFSAAGVGTLYEYNASQPTQPLPAVLIAVDNFAEFIETFGSGAQLDDENSLLAVFVGLARQGRAFGLHVVITANRLNVLSSKLYSLFTERYALRLADIEDYSGIVGTSVPEAEEIAGRGYVRLGRAALSFQVALIPGALGEQGQISGEARQIRALGQQMQAFIAQHKRPYARPFKIAALPKSSSYRDVLAEQWGISRADGSFLDQLASAMQQHWAHNRTAEHADWLRVALGVTSGNKIRTLRLEAKHDGVHGMVAGGTGAGKSELLMTLIVGLALNYSPDILNFVLVDYKGGGAFTPFAGLPHCVDIVTNLNKAAVERMFTAINAEIRRRQALNAETGTKDIIEYRKKGLHLSREPYPHLFIIIDEYAEMISENDAYLHELESITRVGRAQGINLVLASQQPKGVTDQMRANIKLRLCLRVEQLETSRELLRRPDAALLPNGMPGRGYMQIGNENPELIQVSYTGEVQPDDRAAPALWPDRAPRTALADEEPPKLYDMVVGIAAELAGRPAPRPWPAFLPKQFSLEMPLADMQRGGASALIPAVTDWLNGDARSWHGIDWREQAMRVVVGLVDNPAEARQDALTLDLGRSHLAVFGDSGMGKTTLLRSLLASLAATHAPDELHAYVLDLGGRNFRSLAELPHVGAVIYADEDTFEERLQRVLELLHRTIEDRQQIFSSADSSGLYDYNARFPHKPLPAIVLLIDNFAELQENFETLIETSLIPLARRSLGVGITLVVATSLHTHLPGRLYNLFGERVTFKQSNIDSYLDIVGRGAAELGDLPGRGYIRRDRRPLAFQTALPAGLLDGAGHPMRPEAEELRQLGAQMQTAAHAARALPQPVRVLAEQVPLTPLLSAAGAATQAGQAVLGQGGDLRPALLDLCRAGPHFMIVGPPLSGKTTALYTLVFSLADRYSPAHAAFVLVDTQRRFVEYSGNRTLADLPHTLAYVNEVEQLDGLVERLKAECATLADGVQRDIFIIIDNFDDFSEEIESSRTLGRELTLLARRYGRDGLHIIAAGTPDSGSSDLKRRMMASNYGLGLRTTAAIEALRVLRTPAALRNKELSLGRGFIVKSGQTTLVQVADPYDEHSAALSGGATNDEQRARALDGWVTQVAARYSEQATWRATSSAAPATNGTAPAEQQKIAKFAALLRAGMQREVAHLKQSNGADALITEQFVALEAAQWSDAAALRALIKALYQKDQQAQGMTEDMAKMMADMMDDESLLLALEGANNR